MTTKKRILWLVGLLAIVCALVPWGRATSHVFGALDVANAWTGIQNFVNGFTFNGSATAGQYARANGTAFVSSAIQQGDLPSTSTQTIASGTAAMGTSAIASGACASVVTVSASGVATTDVIEVGYNSDPTAVTGYGASSSGAVLTIYPYPTSGNVNFKVCNSTGSSITPGSLTLNFRVVR